LIAIAGKARKRDTLREKKRSRPQTRKNGRKTSAKAEEGPGEQGEDENLPLLKKPLLSSEAACLRRLLLNPPHGKNPRCCEHCSVHQPAKFYTGGGAGNGKNRKKEKQGKVGTRRFRNRSSFQSGKLTVNRHCAAKMAPAPGTGSLGSAETRHAKKKEKRSKRFRSANRRNALKRQIP